MPLTEDTVTSVDANPVRPDEADHDLPPPAIPPEVRAAVRSQVAQAIQPVLADFRAHSVRAVREQVEQAQEADRGTGRPPPSRRDDGDSRQTDGVEGQPLPEQDTAPVRSVASEVVGRVPGFLEDAGTRWLRSRLED